MRAGTNSVCPPQSEIHQHLTGSIDRSLYRSVPLDRSTTADSLSYHSAVWGSRAHLDYKISLSLEVERENNDRVHHPRSGVRLSGDITQVLGFGVVLGEVNARGILPCLDLDSAFPKSPPIMANNAELNVRSSAMNYKAGVGVKLWYRPTVEELV
ncbi:hypothetical protein J6590_099463 [Homalodisca vitripennis]|nr:hypothetical protein J6590_099463 [Homalodisca vitripennis]